MKKIKTIQTNKSNIKLIITPIIGNSLEFYDLALFGFLTPILMPIFFPSDNPIISMIASLGAFAIGFIPRPLGAILFGHIGDKYGRKKSLMISIILMAIPTFLIGIMPSYAQIGLASPILVMFCRFCQGICIGGEYNGSAIFFLEHCAPNRRGFYGALISAAAVFGFFTASIVALICTQSWMPTWGWRLSFILGSLIALFGFYIRKDIAETPEFSKIQQKQEIKKLPFWDVIYKMPLASILTIGVASCMGCLSLSLFGYMIPYLTKIIKLEPTIIRYQNLLAILWYMLFTPFTGWLSDRIGSYKILMTTAIASLFCAKIIYILLSSGDVYNAFFGQFLLATLAASFLGPLNAFVYNLFPTSLRYTGIAFNFSLGLALLGGNAPVIGALLIYWTNDMTAPAFYLMLTSFIGIMSLLGVKKRHTISHVKENIS